LHNLLLCIAFYLVLNIHYRDNAAQNEPAKRKWGYSLVVTASQGPHVFESTTHRFTSSSHAWFPGHGRSGYRV